MLFANNALEAGRRLALDNAVFMHDKDDLMADKRRW